MGESAREHRYGTIADVCDYMRMSRKKFLTQVAPTLPGVTVETPLEGMGIGQQLAWLAAQRQLALPGVAA